MRIFIILLSFLLAASSITASAAAYPITGTPVPQYQSFDTGVISMMRHWHLAGGAVAIMKNGKIVYSRGFGYANLADHTKIQPDTLFRIASTSKAITASAVLSLVQQGKLKLSDRVFDVLNLSPLPGQTENSQVKTMTVADLLYMTSGWSKWFDPLFGPWPSNYAKRLGQTPPVDCQTVARFMMSQAPNTVPGSTFVYSNLNYCILGLVVAKASGMPYADYVKTNILKPVGVTDMLLANTQLGMQSPREPLYYPINPDNSPSTKEFIRIPGLPYGDNQLLFKNAANGGWVASAPDLAKWANGLRTGQLLNNTLLHIMLSPPPSFKARMVRSSKTHKMVAQRWPYGMGWFLSSSHGKPFYFTHGSFTGTNSVIFWRNDGTILVAVFNQKPVNYSGVQAVRNQIRRLFVKNI